MELVWYKQSEIVKEKVEPLIAIVGRFKILIREVQGKYYVSLKVMKYSGTYFLIDHEKTNSLRDAMDMGESLLKNITTL